MKKISLLILIILAFVNYRNLNIGFLSVIQVDEYAFHNSLVNMYNGLIHLNLVEFFSYNFYSYGFIFFLFNLLFSLPAFFCNNIEMTIYIPRVISSLFAVGSLYLLHNISKKYTSIFVSFMIVFLVLSMPGFWVNAMWFHPDWMMTFFVVLSILFYSKDNFSYGKYFWYGTISFAIAISTKVQAITFYPFLFFYIFYENFSYKSLKNLKTQISILVKSICLTVMIFVLTNPYLLHPFGFRSWINFFLGNLESNRTNHGSNVVLTYHEKIINAINNYYYSSIVFIFVIVVAIFSLRAYFSKKEKNVFSVISIYVLLNLCYLFFFVNKDWQHYYLTPLIISPLLFCGIKKIKYLSYVIIALIVLNLGFTSKQHFSNFAYHSISEKDKEKNAELVNFFKNKISKKTNILIESGVPFDFTSIGLDFSQIHIFYGKLNEKKLIEKSFNIAHPYRKFITKDFIVINKTNFFVSKGIIDSLNTSGELKYEKFTEGDFFYIWKKK